VLFDPAGNHRGASGRRCIKVPCHPVAHDANRFYHWPFQPAVR
jgi:hypothetical protein